MNRPDDKIKKHIKLETAFLFAFIALIIGFLGGVVFSAFRMGAAMPAASSVVSDSGSTEQSISPEHAGTISDLEKRVAESPDDVESWIALGNEYFDHNLPGKAIPAYKTALKYQPDSADVWTDLGVMYRRDERPEEAIKAFDRAQAINPRHEVSLFNKGVVLMHDLNDPSAAAETWHKLVSLNPAATTPSGMLVKDLVETLARQDQASEAP